MTWGRRMKSQQELPAFVRFSDSLSLRGLVHQGSGLGVSNMSPININSRPSVTENTLIYLTSNWSKFLLSLDCKYALPQFLPWFCSTLTLWHTSKEQVHETLSIVEYAMCAVICLLWTFTICWEFTWLVFLPLNCLISLKWMNLTPLQMTRNWG